MRMEAMRGEPSFEMRAYDDLTRREIWEIFHLREVVFVVGQKITAEPEVDELDLRCVHALAREGGRLVATARILETETPRIVGRVAVHPERQRQGLGSWVMRRIQHRLGDTPAELHAQQHLEAWYARLGWERLGEPFVEAEIPHVRMRWSGL